jgi:SAM-dependent methyltransferase
MTLAPTIENPAYFDRLADVEVRHWWALGMWRLASYWLDEALAGRRGLRALDVGCGTGMTAVRLSRRPEIETVIGLDPSPEALDHARRRHGFPLVRGSALDLPFGDGWFDVLTCFDVFQHLPDHAGDLRAAVEIRRVLAPGGVAVVRSNGRGFSRDRSGYRLGDLIEVLSASGLTVVRATYANSLPALVQEVRGRLSMQDLRCHPAGGGLQIQMPRPALNRVMMGVTGAEAWLAGRHGMRLPFGHSTLVYARAPG